MRKRLSGILARESGAVVKDPGGKVSIALLYPNRYRAGMSSLGFQGIYGLLNARPDVQCERSFLPEPGETDGYFRSGRRLVTLESQKPVANFHIVAFSVSYENDYPNVLKMLKLSGIPFRASERTSEHPLVILGGVCTAYNPEPLADFMDVVFLGEAEGSLTEFIDRLNNGSSDRAKLLADLATVEGIYIPSLYEEIYEVGRFARKRSLSSAPEKVRRGRPADLDQTRLNTAIRTRDTEFADMAMVEVMRGCPWSCRFCVASKAYRPVRYRSPDAIREMIAEARCRFGKIGLVGPSISDYAPLTELMDDRITFSVSSLRATRNAEPLIRRLAARGQKSLSVAPEAATERLRRAIKKRITEKDILETSRLILESGISQLRLYFMIGLPTERNEDVEAIPALTARVRDLSSSGRIVLSVSPFVPKPFTPFQWMPMNRPEALKQKMALVKDGVRRLNRVEISHDPIDASLFEGFLARGDRRTSGVLSEMVTGNRRDWPRICKEQGLEWDLLLFEPWDFDAPLPWSYIDAGIRPEDLAKECRRALREA